MFQDTIQLAWQKTCLEAYGKGYADALNNGNDGYQPGKYGSKYYLPAYREGFLKGMEARKDVQEKLDKELSA